MIKLYNELSNTNGWFVETTTGHTGYMKRAVVTYPENGVRFSIPFSPKISLGGSPDWFIDSGKPHPLFIADSTKIASYDARLINPRVEVRATSFSPSKASNAQLTPFIAKANENDAKDIYLMVFAVENGMDRILNCETNLMVIRSLVDRYRKFIVMAVAIDNYVDGEPTVDNSIKVTRHIVRDGREYNTIRYYQPSDFGVFTPTTDMLVSEEISGSGVINSKPVTEQSAIKFTNKLVNKRSQKRSK